MTNIQNRGGCNWGLDLLRIVAMLMIVGNHFMVHGIQFQNISGSSLNLAIAFLYYSFSRVDVNCFVLISGYFLIRKNSFSWKKVSRLWIQVLFYSVLFCFLLWGTEAHSIKEMIKAFLPIKTNRYWFITCYVGLYLLHPFLNCIATNVTKKQYLYLLFLLVGMFSIYSFKGGTFTGNGSLLWFITLYFTGGYIRKYGIPWSVKQSVGLYVASALTTYLGLNVHLLIKGNFFSGTLIGNNSPSVFLGSVALFCIFKDMKINEKCFQKIIQFLAPATFGVYLIHDNNFVRPYLWHDLLNVKQYLASDYFFLFFIGIVCVVFVGCIGIEKMREALFKFCEKQFQRPINCIGYQISQYCQNVRDRVIKIFTA